MRSRPASTMTCMRAILFMREVAQAANVTYHKPCRYAKGQEVMYAPWWSASRPARWGYRPDGLLISSLDARSRAVTTKAVANIATS